MKDREKFEAWFTKEMDDEGCELSEFNNGNYRNEVTQSYWLAWQAALASQQPADDGWIEWAGGECPVNINSLVNVRYKSGGGDLEGRRAEVYNWSHNDKDCYPIIAYRVVKP